MGCWSPWILQAFQALTLKKLQLCDVQYQHLHEHVQIHDKKQTMFSISVCFRDIHHSSFSTPPCCSVSPAEGNPRPWLSFIVYLGQTFVCVCDHMWPKLYQNFHHSLLWGGDSFGSPCKVWYPQTGTKEMKREKKTHQSSAEVINHTAEKQLDTWAYNPNC